ncbi:hypothetical protein Y032_0009g637 [Ancylostoma ceylanicum]|uniref:Uncharacterized protein n=1 Tax=Ancylostoma ceylanicum TaxID=53326 RepID=A0A016VI47_9BILA|nr:hypothetical protein Y032_0009g637 [Ancylostoma ceylanicum]
MAKVLGRSRESVRMILRGAGRGNEANGQLIIEQAKVKSFNWCERLRKRFAAKCRQTILFPDEEWFDIEKAHNRNDRMWSKKKPPLEKRMISRRLKPKQVMV